jgi:transcriptional regulator with XRE-family HTH domain
MSVATIGSALAEKRRELGLEKGQAADKIGMSRTTYSSYEQDAQRPSVDVFPALAEFLSVSMEELLALYGATCVAAIRPSLERLLSDRGADSNDQLDNDDSPRPDHPEAPQTFTEEAPSDSGSAIGSNEALRDDDEITVESNVRVHGSDVASLDVAEATEMPELPDMPVQLDSVNLDTFSPPETVAESSSGGQQNPAFTASRPHGWIRLLDPRNLKRLAPRCLNLRPISSGHR